MDFLFGKKKKKRERERETVCLICVYYLSRLCVCIPKAMEEVILRYNKCVSSVSVS